MEVLRVYAHFLQDAGAADGVNALGLVIEQPASHIEGMTGEEPERRALARPGQHLGRHEGGIAEPGVDVLELAQFAVQHRLPAGHEGRIDAVVKIDHEFHASGVDRAQDRFGVFGCGRQRLLHQDVLSGIGGGYGDLAVGEIRRGDGDGGNIVAREQIAIIGVDLRRAITLGNFTRARFVQVADGDQLRSRQVVINVGVPGAADNAGPDDAESNFGHVNSSAA